MTALNATKFLALVVVLLLMVAFGDSSDTVDGPQEQSTSSAPSDVASDRNRDQIRSPGRNLFQAINARTATVSRAGGYYETVAQAMPQVRYTIDGAAPISIADLYVVGGMVNVEPGRSFGWTLGEHHEPEGPRADESEIRHELDFNGVGAQVSTVHVTIVIDRAIVDPNKASDLAERIEPGSQLTFALALSAPVDVDAVRADLEPVGTLAVLLYEGSPVFDYDPTLFAVLEDGAFLGHILDGTVYFPALDHTRDEFPVEELEADFTRDPIPLDTSTP